jgi:hypothetical protein
MEDIYVLLVNLNQRLKTLELGLEKLAQAVAHGGKTDWDALRLDVDRERLAALEKRIDSLVTAEAGKGDAVSEGWGCTGARIAALEYAYWRDAQAKSIQEPLKPGYFEERRWRFGS